MEPKTAFWGAIIIGILLWFLPSSNDILGLFPFNDFEIFVTEEFKEKIQYETISIKKLGFNDAESVLITIESYESKKIESNTCFDGNTLSLDKDRKITIEFEKMSANYECTLIISSSPDTKLYDINIIANELPEYEWSSVDQFFDPIYKIMFMALAAVIGWGAYSIIKLEFHKSNVTLFHYGSISLNELNNEYGEGFIELDEEILRAIKKNNKTIDKISIFLNLPKKDIKKRIKFMEKKGVLYFD